MRKWRFLPCSRCGRDNVEFRPRRRTCIECEGAETRVCDACMEAKHVSKFSGKHSICHVCRYKAGAEYAKSAARARHFRLQAMVFAAYGRSCACCGESRKSMLCLDHINNDGAKHRREMTSKWNGAWANKNISGTSVYADVVKRGFPAGFQILCANCNTSKARNGGVCEHKSEGVTTIPEGSRAKSPEAHSTR